jgi:diaminopimelate epimerase
VSVPVPFAKLQGAGNGYIAIDGRELEQRWPAVDWSQLARQITDPNFGVGSDGVAVVATSKTASIWMRIFNSDGSEAEMSGNGIRLFAKFVLDRGLAACEGGDGALEVETGGGLRRVFPEYSEESGEFVAARVAMDEPKFGLPGALGGGAAFLEADLGPELGAFTITPVSLGNPHAVLFSEAPVAEFDLERVGPRLQSHPWFPERVNVEVARILGPGRIEARIFERGEGETLASGTGSTACAVAAIAHVLVEISGGGLDVELCGGTLRVEWAGAGEPAWLQGPAVQVFEGVWYPPQD